MLSFSYLWASECRECLRLSKLQQLGLGFGGKLRSGIYERTRRSKVGDLRRIGVNWLTRGRRYEGMKEQEQEQA